MEVKLNIGYDQLLKLVKQLPASQLARLKTELDDKFLTNKSKEEISELQNFLLEGPVMTDDEYKLYLENRKKINQWRQR